MKQQLWGLCLLCLCLSACASPPPADRALVWQGPPMAVQMTIWVTHKGTTIPTQALLRLTAKQQDLNLILVYGSTVGHCQLTETRAYCTPAIPAMSPVLASVGDATAQLVYSLGPQGNTTVAQTVVAPPHMQFSEQRITDFSQQLAWPTRITVHDTTRDITLNYTITEITPL